MPEQVLLDPTDESTGTQLDISDGTAYGLIDHAYPVPPMKAIYASSVDTEGGFASSLSYENRVLSIKVRVVGTSAANLEARLGAVSRKMGKFQREGGTLRRVTPAGTSITFDVLPDSSGGVTSFGKRYINNEVAEIELTFTCRPFGRGAAVQLSDHTETSNPEIVFTETGIDGDVPGLGRLVIDEDQGADQWFVMWGIQSRFYDAATSAKLVWAASEITALGTSTLTAGATGAFGGGSNVIRNTDLTTTFQAIASTQATGGGAHLSHVGDFVVWARVYTPNNGADIELALEWAEGDFRRVTRNPSVTVADAWQLSWRLVNLGQVHLSKVPQGTQRWEGRLVAKSTGVGDRIDVNRLWLMPCTEGYGEAYASGSLAAPVTFAGQDSTFAVSNLHGQSLDLPAATTWATAGDTTDLAGVADGTVQRSVETDNAQIGRRALAGSGTFSNIAVRVDLKHTALTTGDLLDQGVVFRFVDANNWARAGFTRSDSEGQMAYLFWNDGGVFNFRTVLLPANTDADAWYTALAYADATGRVRVWLARQGTPLGDPVLTVTDSVFATGGALDDGQVGFVDRCSAAATTVTRNYDNFAAWVPNPGTDAAIFASQSLELRHDQVIREDSAGTLWPEVSDYQGRHLFVPPAGQEGRTTRIIVKAARSIPSTMPDHTAADDISARLTYTPRYLQVPET